MNSRITSLFSTATMFLSALMLFAGLTSSAVFAAGMKNINVSNGPSQSTVTITFDGSPDYSFFPLHNPERVVMDIRQDGVMKGLPLTFNGQNLVTRVRASSNDRCAMRVLPPTLLFRPERPEVRTPNP